MRTARQAWQHALYGPQGFYRRGRGAGTDFRTASTAGPLLAEVLLGVAARLDDELGHRPDFGVVDVGAGDGSLLAQLAAAAPRGWRLTGVETRRRPADLPARVCWQPRIPPVHGLLVAVEWLDAVPCELLRDGRVLLEDGSPGAPPGPAARRWLDQWWPGWRDGAAEVGASRDDAWLRAVGRVRSGLALAVDYGHDRAHRRPTFVGFRAGRAVPPVFDGSCDLTAHVALDSLTGRRRTQREALRRLGVSAAPPAAGSGRDGLRRAGEQAELIASAGLGSFGWVSVANGVADLG